MYMDTSLSPENILKRYIANCEYGLWRHDRDRFDRPHHFWPEETPSLGKCKYGTNISRLMGG